MSLLSCPMTQPFGGPQPPPPPDCSGVTGQGASQGFTMALPILLWQGGGAEQCPWSS